VRTTSLIALACLAAFPAGASNAVSLGYSDETTIIGPGTDACASGVLIHNHDGSFENGYAWRYGGQTAPYYGAFGEGYDVGAGTVSCAAFWLSDLIPDFWENPAADCYIWEGGTESPPDAVLGIVTADAFNPMGVWPSITQFDVEMNMSVAGPFTIGYWGHWPSSGAEWCCAADENGPGGHPWTCIAPGIGYPSGWQDPAVVWPDARSMGIGVYFEQATPVESETWGAVKALFREGRPVE
jgi:hypothetical protein